MVLFTTSAAFVSSQAIGAPSCATAAMISGGANAWVMMQPSSAVVNGASSLKRRHATTSSSFSSSPLPQAAASIRSACRGPLMMTSPTSSADANDEVTKLLAQAAQARAEAAELEKALGRVLRPKQQTNTAAGGDTAVETASSSSSVAVATKPPTKAAAVSISATELVNKLNTLDDIIQGSADSLSSASAAEACVSMFSDLQTEGLCSKWNSFNYGEVRAVSQSMLKAQTGIDEKALSIDMDLNDLKVAIAAVAAGSAIAAILSGTVIGGNLGASLTYIFALLPIIFLGIGSTAPGLILSVINQFKMRQGGDFNDRRVRHEAAHFLAGYLCGLPIKEVRLDSATTCVEFYDATSGDQATLNRPMNKEEINRVSVVALAGAMGEVQEFGTATGAAEDLDLLGRLMNRANYVLDPKAQENQARWGCLMAYQLMQTYSKEYAAALQAFREGKEIKGVIAAIETC